MALARSFSGPGGLSINTNSANSLAGLNTAPAGGMFGSTAASKPATGLFGATGTSQNGGGGLFGSTAATSQPQTGGLFGSTTGAATQPQTGGLFGSTATSQPQTGGLFGSAATSQPQTGGLFGSTAAASQPQTGGLFGSTAAASQPQTGGLFGSKTTTQPQAGGGLFGTSITASQPQTGGLFGSAAPASQPQTGGLLGAGTGQMPAAGNSLFGGFQNQNKPATSLFGGLGNTQNQQPQQQQNSMFSTQNQQNQPQGQGGFSNTIQGGGLTLGQSTSQNQQAIPGVRIDVTNLRGTTRFNDLYEDLQLSITKIDEVIQGQIKLKNDCDAIMPAHDQQLSQIPSDWAFCNRKLTGVESALESDVKSIAFVRDTIKTDAENAKLSFRAVDNLKLPSQYHNSGMWSTKSSSNRPAGDEEDDTQDIVGLFSTTTDELAATLNRFRNNLTEIEQHLRGIETSSAQQINSFVAKRNGGSAVQEDPVAELGAVLQEFEQSVLGVAGKVGSAREGVQGLQLRGFQQPTNANVNGKRSGVY